MTDLADARQSITDWHLRTYLPILLDTAHHNAQADTLRALPPLCTDTTAHHVTALTTICDTLEADEEKTLMEALDAADEARWDAERAVERFGRWWGAEFRARAMPFLEYARTERTLRRLFHQIVEHVALLLMRPALADQAWRNAVRDTSGELLIPSAVVTAQMGTLFARLRETLSGLREIVDEWRKARDEEN